MRFTKEEWHGVQIRCNKIPFHLAKMSNEKVLQYCELYATARNTHPAFIYSLSLGLFAGMLPYYVGLENDGWSQESLSTFILAIGIPSCGKSTAFDAVVSKPITSVQARSNDNFTFTEVTKEGLLAALDNECHHAALVSDELGLYFEKLLHRQNKDRTGETQVYSTIWSGMPMINRQSNTRHTYIPKATVAISGTIQTELALQMLANLPVGDGFKDRLLLLCPKTLKTHVAERQVAAAAILELKIPSPTQVAQRVHSQFHNKDPFTFRFSDAATQYLKSIDTIDVESWNEATNSDVIPEGKKSLQITKRCAALISLFETVVVPNSVLSPVIELSTLKRAEAFVQYCTAITETFQETVDAKSEDARPTTSKKGAHTEEVDVIKRLITWKKENCLPSVRQLQQCGPSGRDGVRNVHGKGLGLKQPEIVTILNRMANAGLGKLIGAREDIFQKEAPKDITDEALQFIDMDRDEYRHFYE